MTGHYAKNYSTKNKKTFHHVIGSHMLTERGNPFGNRQQMIEDNY